MTVNPPIGRVKLALRRVPAIALAACALLAAQGRAHAGKLSWLDDLIERVVLEAKAEAKASARGAEKALARSAEKPLVRSGAKYFARSADDGIETAAREFDGFLKRGGRTEHSAAEALLDARFSKLASREPRLTSAFRTLSVSEKRVVVEMSETAQAIARRFPDEAETIIRKLGPEGMAAARIYGPDVARTIAQEGPETVGILRKTGAGGWEFFTKNVLPHKKKLIAAGVFAAFLANPERFTDTAGKATQYAAEQFARAGIKLAGAFGGGVADGVAGSLLESLANRGLGPRTARAAGIAVAGAIAIVALFALLGVPLRYLLSPLTWTMRRLRSLRIRKPAGLQRS